MFRNFVISLRRHQDVFIFRRKVAILVAKMFNMLPLDGVVSKKNFFILENESMFRVLNTVEIS